MERELFCCICSDRGKYRSDNEDNYIFNRDYLRASSDRFYKEYILESGWNICGVLDGMGGMDQGEKASCLAAGVFSEAWNGKEANLIKREIDEMMRASFLNANNRIIENSLYSGTTATISVTDGNLLKLFHLGDSRAFLIHAGEIRQLTKDQTVENMKKDLGMEDQVMETDKHRLTEYLGADQSQKGIRPVESEWMPFLENDSIILCTDGLYEGCDLRDMLNITETEMPKRVAEALVKLALSKEVKDNITCMYIYGRLKM